LARSHGAAVQVCNDILARTDATVAFTVRFALVGPDMLRALRVD